ncbi:MAG: hypothetical protein IJC07_03350 [Clostridia bacterium]|nr:hypothetical protein [Clostridia bacterium]
MARKIQVGRAFLQGSILEKYVTEQNAMQYEVFFRQKSPKHCGKAD